MHEMQMKGAAGPTTITAAGNSAAIALVAVTRASHTLTWSLAASNALGIGIGIEDIDGTTANDTLTSWGGPRPDAGG
jgi:hypothetical protein